MGDAAPEQPKPQPAANPSAEGVQNGDVGQRGARAPPERKPTEPDAPTKKRKTRRGKSKRRHPYLKNGKLNVPEAPHNSNQFLLEDHGIIEELDENLKCFDQASTSSVVTRTRDSSFSVDSDGEFYSSPDDEEQFLRKDFDDQYESLQAERLHAMTKTELISEYIQLQNKVDTLTRRLQSSEESSRCDAAAMPSDEFERLKVENETLRQEIDVLRSRNMSCSEDSETDSSDSCSSSTSSSASSMCSDVQEQEKPQAEVRVDYSHANGQTSPPIGVESV